MFPVTNTPVHKFSEPSIMVEADTRPAPSLFPALDPQYFNQIANYTKKLRYQNSIATVSLAGEGDNVYTRLDKVASAGFKLVEIMVQDTDEASPELIYKHCQKLGLEVAVYQPFRDFEGIDEAIPFKVAELKKFFAVADVLHTDLIVMCASCQENAVSDRDLIVKHLRIAADVAAENNKHIAFESLAWSKTVVDLKELSDIVAAVDRPNFGICLDTFHIYSKPSDLLVLDKLQGKVKFVQLADAPLLELSDLLTYSRNYRTFPMQGEFDNLKLLEKINQLGYKGPLSLEVFNSAFKKGDKKALADDGFRSILLLQLLSQNLLPEAPKIKGVFMENDSFVTPSQLSNIDVIIQNKDSYMERTKLFSYYSNAITLIDNETLQKSRPNQKLRKRINVLCKDRLEFIRIILYFHCVLGFKVLRNDPENFFNDFGLSLNLTFGTDDSDDLKIGIATSDV